MEDIKTLSALNTHLQAEIENSPSRTLTPLNVGISRLARFLTEVPDRAIPFESVSLEMNNAGDKLTLAGNTNMFWRVQSWGSRGITIRHITMSFTELTGELVVECDLNGVVELDGNTMPLKGVLTDKDSLQFTLPAGFRERASLVEIANLITQDMLEPYLPPGVELFDTVPVSEFECEFGFLYSSISVNRFTSNIGVNWKVAGDKIQLKKTGITLRSQVNYSPFGNLESTFSGNIHATVTLGEDFDVKLELSNSSEWLVEIIPRDGNVLPGLESLASVVGGEQLRKTIKTGLERFDFRLSLDYVGIGIDIPKKKVRRVQLNGHLDFLGVTFLVETNIPNFEFHGLLSPQTPIHLKELLGNFFNRADDFPAVDITQLAISMQPGLDAYGLSLIVQSDWKLSIGEIDLEITEFGAEIRKQNKGVTGWIEGKFTFLNADFELFARHPEVGGGWQFDGHTVPDTSLKLGVLISDIAEQFGAETHLPHSIKDLEIKRLQVSFNTATKDFLFYCDTQFSLDQNSPSKKPDAVITVSLTHNDGKYHRKYSGAVTIENLQFDLIFDQQQGADNIFLAAYENKAGKDQSIQPLVELITENNRIINAAEGISFNLKDALLVVDQRRTTKILFGLDIGGGIDISNLPLVGKMFPTDSAVRMTLQPLLTNRDFSTQDLSKVRALAPAGGYQLPKEATKRLDFNMQLMLGGEVLDLSVPIDVDAVKDQSPVTAGSSVNTTDNTAQSFPPTSSDNIKWFPIQKQLGPVNFGRVGVQFQDSQLYFLIDASLSLSGLTISLDGLFAKSKLNPIHPEFGLHGLGIDYKKGELEIGGAFLRQTFTDPQGRAYDSYDGTAVIRTSKFSLAALGSYAHYQGHPSLFIYAFVDAPIGGPAFFFVTGLAAGFGYNRRLLMPGLKEVKNFPLVAQAMAGKSNDLSKEINLLHEVIPPAVGEVFLAVGVRFSSFKIIDSFALLAVSFGAEFEVDVLGLSTLILPTAEKGTSIEPLADVELALQAVFNPDKGFLKVRAGLTPASFILSRNCHLTGGFAFYTWFKDDEAKGIAAGDFVLSLGGYHPRFKAPAHYPRVSPLGFNWDVGYGLTVKGDFYFALVSSAVMTGGHLSATWVSGNLKAWFAMGADFIISWKPYFYDAYMYLDMGVSYTYHFFGTHHISVDVGADLHVWGPEFSGNAHVHLWIVTFDVAFGAHSAKKPKKIDWQEFKESFLPEETKKWTNIAVTKGLSKKLDTNDGPLFIINPKDFALETDSVIPITESNHDLDDSTVDINIGSMEITNGITSSHKVTIHRANKDNTTSDITGEFVFTPIKKNVPGALWGASFKHTEHETENQRLIKNVCTGFSISRKAVAATPSDATHSIESEQLLTEVENFGKSIKYEASLSGNGNWLKNRGEREKVAQEIETRSAQRDALLAAMDFDENFHPNKELADEFAINAA